MSQEFKAYSGNEFFLVDRFLSMIIHSDFFITNNVCDYFPFISKRIYIHHDIYDTPLTSKKKEAGLKQRLLKYNFVLVSSDLGKIVFENLFKQEQHKPEIISIGYLKLDFLIQKYKQKKNRSIVIAITNFNAFRDFSCIEYIVPLIDLLLKSTNYKIFFRPHPSNQSDKKVIDILKKFRNKKRFYLDKSKNYAKVYFNSSLMITDLSGTAYTYAFLTKNPVIFFSPNEHLLKTKGYDKINFFIDRNQIGKVYQKIEMFKKLANFDQKIYKKKILKLINKRDINIGSSKDKFQKFIKNN